MGDLLQGIVRLTDLVYRKCHPLPASGAEKWLLAGFFDV